MSLLPFVVSELLDELHSPQQVLYDQHFGLGLHPNLEPTQPRIMRMPLNSGYLRPWRQGNMERSGLSSMVNSKADFRVNLDVQQFKPEEISVKLQDNFIIVDAKHEEREDKHGFVSRHFTRRYKLPENVDVEKINSKLSSDGVLCLFAPKKIENSSGEINIPVVCTNQPILKQTPKGHGEGEQTVDPTN